MKDSVRVYLLALRPLSSSFDTLSDLTVNPSIIANSVFLHAAISATQRKGKGKGTMKLHCPPRLHFPSVCCRQFASLKSVTGLNSAYTGRAAYHLEFSASIAFCASSSYLYLAYTFPTKWSPVFSHTCISSSSPYLHNSL